MEISTSLHRERSRPDGRGPWYHERKRRRRAVGLKTQERRDDDVGQAGDLATEELRRRLGIAAGRETAQGIGDKGTLAYELRGLCLERPLVTHVTGHVDVSGDRVIRAPDRRGHRAHVIVRAVLS